MDPVDPTIDRGKTLVIRLQGRTEPDEEGYCKVFFELNGQPRLIRIAKAGAAINVRAHPKVEEGNANHVGAPMPGSVVMVAVKPEQRVAKGDPLISLEAMKMEAMICAERDAIVKAVFVKSGDAVDAKDLLVELE